MNDLHETVQRVLERAQSASDDVAALDLEQRKREARDALRDIVPRGLMEGRDVNEAFRNLPGGISELVGWTWGDGPVLVVGSTGRGKTTACALLVRRLLLDWVHADTPVAAKALRASWWRSRALAREVQNTPFGKECKSLVTALRAPLLVLDDIGWEPDPAFVGDLLCERTDHGRPTIATSGQTVEALEQRYGQPLVRRFIERGKLLEAW